ncbi:MAG: hypothetical protein II000_09120 [Clostridia bacterium]|nr:hypothetical protein [Clostridia bacterium]
MRTEYLPRVCIGRNAFQTNFTVDYDWFPRIVSAGKETVIHIRQLGGSPRFLPDTEYTLIWCAVDQGKPVDWPVMSDYETETVRTDSEGNFHLPHTFPSEQEYYLRFYSSEDRLLDQFPVYCVAGDLIGLYPFMGDTHLHSFRSDGRQAPEVVAANYRKIGYDFLTITDHHRYYPSLEAMRFYKNVPTELCIVPGEEVQLPDANGLHNDVHIINFGGLYSVNALTEGLHQSEVGDDKMMRSVDGNAPDSMTLPEYEALMKKLTDEIDCPKGIDRFPAANCKWVFDEIRKADGLGIFAHPYWISDAYHVPPKFMDYLVEHEMFDAFEVLGGERYYEQNGFQTIRYYEDKANGHIYPIVGATDSHSSYPTNDGAYVAATVVFAEKNERKTLISAIKNFYSVAVDKISKEFRMVGDLRLVKYATYLYQYYFPMHDELCFEEGRLLKQVATGLPEERAEAIKTLECICGRVGKLRDKYFDF